MVLQSQRQWTIENLRHYPTQTIEQLRELLAAGVPARLDPRRENFYELESPQQVFYIHVSPVNGKVILLATWRKNPEPACKAADRLDCHSIQAV